ncbi:MAG: maltose alpha-D-glucosyltransferase [Planctomycetes bacterium]|nr:maltose alpha-D-glucosyltransferase [Planctomycetota bacterium]
MPHSDADPLWYKDAIIYQVHVRAFYDHDGDGIGDFEGLTAKLDYLQDLGVTALWLLPFYPSPLRDDGYDIANYVDVNPIYGNLRDFKTFLREAHARGLRVITELVLNHTSDEHAWFQRSRRARPGSSWRDFYVWSDTPEKYEEARIIFKDFEASNWAWDREAKAYYWHRFYSHQPDLNFDNPRVRRALKQVLDRWLDMGVDGLRLDAVPYLYEREGTNCENLPETHAFLKELRQHIDQKHANRMVLAEANQWPEDAIAYFGDGDECHPAFHFPVMPRLFRATQMEDRFPIIDIMAQTPAIPGNCQWVLFLRNHDELTLEMVTDEERDYMYRVYAREREARINLGIRRRLAPLLGNNRRKVELLNALLFSLPGTPVIYYGDEIGMGDNIYLGDRDGVRTPMQWSADRNAGFSRANPQRLYLPPIIDFEYHYETLNVETQRANPESLLWWMKRLIALRQRYPVFGRGTLEFLYPDNAKVLAFIRADAEVNVLVVTNLSRSAQFVELDLSRFEGMVPVELYGRTRFPPIGKLPYLLTLSPHAFYWFALEPQQAAVVGAEAGAAPELPALKVDGEWTNLFAGRARLRLENVLLASIGERRWFGGKARAIQSLHIADTIPFERDNGDSTYLALLNVDYAQGEPETYVLPLSLAAGVQAEALQSRAPQAAIARVLIGGQMAGVLYDALYDETFPVMLLDAISQRRRFRGSAGELFARPTQSLAKLRDGHAPAALAPHVLRGEQSNTSVAYGDRRIQKLFRRVEGGVNPDLEIGRYLTESTDFTHFPPVAGSLEYESRSKELLTLGVLQAYVANQGTAWQYTLDTLGRFYEQATVWPLELKPEEEMPPGRSLLDLAAGKTPTVATERIVFYLQSAELLGQRTGEMHLALAADHEHPEFRPEPFTQHYQRSIYQSMRKSTAQTLQLLRKRQNKLAAAAQPYAAQVLEREAEIGQCLRALLAQRVHATRIRCHGDYHLGQVLYTGNDFVIIDFEGEPARSLSERRIKRSPIRDVAGMVRSFHYAAFTARRRYLESIRASAEEQESLWRAARFWYLWTSANFLRKYLETVGPAEFIPSAPPQRKALLHAFLLEKSVYELSYELNNRPDWVEAPLLGILDLLDSARCSVG